VEVLSTLLFSSHAKDTSLSCHVGLPISARRYCRSHIAQAVAACPLSENYLIAVDCSESWRQHVEEHGDALV
jgi:hypothetical protein